MQAFDVDAIWTPDAIPIEVGLHSDSTFSRCVDSTNSGPAEGAGFTIVIRARAVEDDSKMPLLGRQMWVPI